METPEGSHPAHGGRHEHRGKRKLSERIKRTLSIVGVGIVLATFVVKDAVREDLKDFVDDLDNASGVFAIRGDFNTIAFQLRVMEQKIDHVEQLTASPTKDPFTLLAVNQQAMIIREWLDAAEITIDNVARLSERLSSDRIAFYAQSLMTLRGQLQDARVAFRAAGVAAARAASRGNPDGTPALQDRDEILRANTEVQDRTTALVTATANLSKVIREEAENLKSQKEHHYKVLTIVSYVLFGLGWALALIGRLTDDDSISGIS